MGTGKGAWVVCKCGCAFLHPAPPSLAPCPAACLQGGAGISSHSKSQLSVRSNGWALGPECGRETERRGHALQQGRGGCKGRRGGRHAGSAPTSTQNMSKRGRIDHGVAKKRRGSIGGLYDWVSKGGRRTGGHRGRRHNTAAEKNGGGAQNWGKPQRCTCGATAQMHSMGPTLSVWSGANGLGRGGWGCVIGRVGESEGERLGERTGCGRGGASGGAEQGQRGRGQGT